MPALMGLPNIVHERFDALGMQILSSEIVRSFPWSTVLRLTLSDGRVAWAKRCGDGMAFEPNLVRILESAGSPLLVPSLWIAGRWIATEHVEGQLERGDARALAAISRAQAPLAELQQRLVPNVDELRRAGTPPLGSRDVQPLVKRAIGFCSRYGHLASKPLEPADEEALLRAVPRLVAELERFEEGAAPVALLHLDLHHGNVFDHDGCVQVLDWGDARIGSPMLHRLHGVTAWLHPRHRHA